MYDEDARRLIKSGRISDLSSYDLLALEYSLSHSTDPEDIELLSILRGSVVSQKSGMTLGLQNQIEANYTAIQNIEKGFNLFAFDSKGRPQSREVLSIFNFFNRVEIDNKSGTEPVKGENLFAQAASVARVSALEELLRDETFAQKRPEEQKKIYIQNVVMAMEEKAFVLLSNQVVENVSGRKNGHLTAQDKAKIKNEVSARFVACIDINSQARFKLSNNNIIGTLVTEVNRAANSAEFQVKTLKNSHLAKEVSKLDNRFMPHYRDSFSSIRPLAQTPNMSMIAGPVGRSAFGAANISDAVRNNNPAKGGKGSLFTFLREHPLQFRLFSENVFGSIKKAYNGLVSAVDFGLVSDKITAGWKNMVKYFSSSKDGIQPTKYNGISKKTIGEDLKALDKKLGKALRNDLSPKEKVIAWKMFGQDMRNSEFGRTILSRTEKHNLSLNPGRYELKPDSPKEYVKVVKIDLSRNKRPMTSFRPAASPASVAKNQTNNGIPRIVGARVGITRT